MDEDEAGDMTDPRTGYDIKIIRSGSGKNDTTYSARACKPTKLDKKYSGNVDLESIVRSQIKDYDELEEWKIDRSQYPFAVWEKLYTSCQTSIHGQIER